MKIQFLSLVVLIFASTLGTAQEFLTGADRFSGSKEAYITLNNGEELVVFVDDIKRKKGLIKSIKVKDAQGVSQTLKPEAVKHMYLSPTGYDKLLKALDKAQTVTKWDEDKSAHAGHIKNGYVFFENTEVMVKKKKMTLMLQLLNPGFANGIKVFFDPLAKESGGLGAKGLNVGGGEAKSYYFKKGNETAIKIEKKTYSKAIKALYGDCPALQKKFDKDMKWSSVEKHVFFYSENCP